MCVTSPVDTDVATRQIFKEFERRRWKLYRTELNIFHCGMRCAGQPDLLCQTETGDVVIIDWKRTPKVSLVGSAAPCLYPLQHVPSTCFFHYALQVNMYRMMLETEYGMKVDSMWLAVCHPRLPHLQRGNWEQ